MGEGPVPHGPRGGAEEGGGVLGDVPKVMMMMKMVIIMIMFQRNVVDFMRKGLGLADTYSEEEIQRWEKNIGKYFCQMSSLKIQNTRKILSHT